MGRDFKELNTGNGKHGMENWILFKKVLQNDPFSRYDFQLVI